MNCVDCKDFTCPHRSGSTGGGPCYYESGEQKEKLLTTTAEATLHYVDWSSFRREAAKDIMISVLSVPGIWTSTTYEGLAVACINQADELIKQLKRDKKCQ